MITETKPSHPFDRSGLATLSDLRSKEWGELFGFLEKEQAEFLARERDFRSPEYKWPRDPLHTWSRIWEYPYAYHHLRTLTKELPSGTLPRLADVGSGVTFFPLSAARLGYHVTCLDIDPICATDISRSARLIPHSPGIVDFALITGDSLPLADDTLDVVISISVLEHIPTFGVTIAEIARILKPGGFLILTIDLDLRGDSEIGVDRYQALLSQLRDHFEFYQPENITHPADVLNTENSPLAPERPAPLRSTWFDFKQVVKAALGRPPAYRNPGYMLPFFLAVQGLVLRKIEA